jgi:ADP-heptose:LPS heptosyltransferase
LGGKTSVPFAGVDISLVGKTTITDLPHILKCAQLHIDNESGMVHLANLTQTACVVLFGPSKAAYLGYARNTNIQSPFCGGCMNISKHWMTQCILGYPPEKQCLAAITVEQVFKAVQKHLS